MPEPPPVGLITKWILENPWPLGALIGLVALVVAYLGVRDGQKNRVFGGLMGLAVAAGIVLTGQLVTTAGEHGKRVARAFVDAVVAEDVTGAQMLLTGDAGLQLGSTTNASLDLSVIIARLQWLAERTEITENRITMLKGYTESNAQATVHMACWTEAGAYLPTPSQWVLQVKQQPNGDWLISRITLISVNGQPPKLTF